MFTLLGMSSVLKILCTPVWLLFLTWCEMLLVPGPPGTSIAQWLVRSTKAASVVFPALCLLPLIRIMIRRFLPISLWTLVPPGLVLLVKQLWETLPSGRKLR